MQHRGFQGMRHAQTGFALTGLQSPQAGKHVTQSFFKRLLVSTEVAFQTGRATHHGFNGGVARP
jgi:hypothetical protein